MESKDIAARILRAEEVSEYVKQVSSIDFCMESDKEGVIMIKSSSTGDSNPIILKIDSEKLPDVVKENIDIEQVCAILNEHLESAKYEILETIQNNVFGDVVEDVKEFKKEDGFEEVELD